MAAAGRSASASRGTAGENGIGTTGGWRRGLLPALVATALFLAALGIGWLVLGSPDKAGAQGSAPPVTHPVTGREDCLRCHQVGGAISLPQDHTGRPVASCLLCHQPAPASPTPIPSPTPPPATPTPPPSPTGPTPPFPTPTPTLPSPTPTPTPTPPPEAPPALAAESCLSCHGVPGLSLNLPSGERLELYVSVPTFVASVHGSRLLCSDCHRPYTQYPHPRRQLTTRREYSLALYEVCRRCHFDQYTRTLDSIHYQLLSQGDAQAPVCTDCHGAHQVMPPDKPRTKSSQTCSRCHAVIYLDYFQSVHGRALVEENPDVPGCTDCHGVHTIRDPRTAAFHLSVPELCARCHSDPEMMGRYGLSTAVTQTYLQDFHGATISLRKQEGSQPATVEAVCTDCHGVHNISRTGEPGSPALRANLVAVCRRCHPDATENFPAAWLSHYEPSLSRSPLVFLVKLFYRIFIPFVIIGLAFQVFLDLWRSVIYR